MSPATIPSYALPISHANSYVYDGVSYGAVVMPLEPLDQQAIDKALGLAQPPGQTVTPGQVSVKVLNGSGQAGQAAQVAGALGALGFGVVGTGDTAVTGVPAETVVRYGPGHLAQAERVAQGLSGEVTMGEDPAAGSEVVVVTGTHLAVATTRVPAPATTSPTPPATATAGTGAPLTPSAAAAPSVAGVTAVLPASPKLPSYDPRACAPGAVAKPATSG
ncbi:MAG: LytR C-terminal domain-containing protein [Acidimicrobiales bacterium]